MARPPADEPPEGLFVIGAVGLIVATIGGAVGGSVGMSMAGIGCLITITGAIIFAATLIERMSGKDGDE
jgi:hypothetical protein